MIEARTLAILFADISGSTRLFERLGDAPALALVGAVLKALGVVALQHGGRVVKTIGDEAMCVFESPGEALHAAVAMQRAVHAEPEFMQHAIALRIGLHHGKALCDGGDVFGDAVNIAARMADKHLARRDQIVTTEDTVAAAGAAVAALRLRSLGEARVAGKSQSIPVVDVLWQNDVDYATTVRQVLRDPSSPPPRLRLWFRAQTFEIDEATPFAIGRDPASPLVLDTEWASRLHALIEWRRGHFVVADRSTNGTWLCIGEEPEIRLHRDETQLRGKGTLRFGQAHADDCDDLVRFDTGEGAA